MLQLSPFPSVQQFDEADMTDEAFMIEDPSIEVVPVIISTTPVPLILEANQRPGAAAKRFRPPSVGLPSISAQYPAVDEGPLQGHSGGLSAISAQYPVVTTEPLQALSGTLPIATLTPSLAAALQATMTTNTTEPIVVIPGSGKHKRAKPEMTDPVKRMSPRLRQGIILATFMFVVIASLVSLSPLASGQNPFPIFRSISNWFQSQQLIWQLPAQSTQSDASAPTLPPVNLPNSQYVAIARQDAIDAGISPDYFVRQINLESGFNPNDVSPSGAVGIAQFLPSTAAGLGINPWDPIQALRGAARLMASYVHQYGGDFAKALAAYNGGTGTVQYAVNNCGTSWLNCLPQETRNYIYVIMGI